jgi:hypothetical protein
LPVRRRGVWACELGLRGNMCVCVCVCGCACGIVCRCAAWSGTALGPRVQWLSAPAWPVCPSCKRWSTLLRRVRWLCRFGDGTPWRKACGAGVGVCGRGVWAWELGCLCVV